MRFLHTSDWHVGRTIRNRSRMDEHRAVFAEIVEIARREQVDAVLVTGDVFHERRPPLAAEELVAQTLAQLARDNIVSVVIVGGSPADTVVFGRAGRVAIVLVVVVVVVVIVVNCMILNGVGRNGSVGKVGHGGNGMEDTLRVVVEDDLQQSIV